MKDNVTLNTFLTGGRVRVSLNHRAILATDAAPLLDLFRKGYDTAQIGAIVDEAEAVVHRKIIEGREKLRIFAATRKLAGYR